MKRDKGKVIEIEVRPPTAREVNMLKMMKRISSKKPKMKKKPC
jgi:hypothetical protein